MKRLGPAASSGTLAAPEAELPLGPEAPLPIELPVAVPDPAARFTDGGALRSRVARGTIINAAFTVGIGVLGLLKGFILARFLTPRDYGIWGVLIVSLSTLLWLKQVGIGDKFVQQDELDQELAFQKAFTLELALTAACVVVMAAVVPVLVLVYRLPQIVLPSVVVALTLMITVFQAPLWVLYRRMEFRRQRTLAAVDPVVGFVTSIGLAVAGAGYWAFVGGLAAGATASSILAVSRSPFPLRLRYEPGTLRSYWSFSGPLLAAGISAIVMSWGAVLSAKLALGVSAVGVIALSANVTSFTDSVDEMITGTLYPAICAVRDRGDLLYESLVKSNRLALMWAVPFGIGLTLFAPDLVHVVLGDRWRSAILVLQVYGAAAAINHVGFNWTAYFRALGRTVPIAVVNAVATAVFLLIGLPLLLWLGLKGFAIGVALQGLAALAMRAFYLQREFPGFDFLRHAARSFRATLIAAAALLLVREAIGGPRPIPRVAAEVAGYALLCAALTWRLESGLLREAVTYLRPTPSG